MLRKQVIATQGSIGREFAAIWSKDISFTAGGHHMRLKDKVAIITGAASGIGRATAHLFAQEGAKLVLNDIDEAKLARLATGLAPAQVAMVAGDIALEETASRLANIAKAEFGRIDILINNAGMHLAQDITDMSSETWDRIMDVNLKSMFHCCKHVIPHMRAQGNGAIVNLGSISAFVGQELAGASTFAYNVSKAGAVQLTRSLATRYAGDGIRINCVCPGRVATEIIKAPIEADPPAEPMARSASPDEIAKAVLFLASDEASFVTGSYLVVDGGFLCR